MGLRKKVFILLGLLHGGIAFSQDQLSASSDESVLQKGIELYNRRAYGPALESFDRYLLTKSGRSSQHAETAYYRASCLLALSHPEGEQAVDKFVQEFPEHPYASMAMLDVADFHYRKADYARAAGAYGKVNFPGLPDGEKTQARFRWGYSLFNLRRLEESLDQFNLVKAESGGVGPAASYYAGFVELSMGRYEASLTDLLRAGQSESYVAAVPFLVTNAYYKLRQYDELLKYVEGLPEGKALNHAEEIELLVAEAHFRKGIYASALPGYEKYIGSRKAAVDRSVLFRAGYSAFVLDKSAQSISYLNRSASERDSLGGYASYYLGVLYLKQGQKDYALNAFEVARSFTSDDKLREESAFQYAKVAYDLGRSEISVSEMEKFLQAYPASSRLQEARELLSHAYVNANNFNKAIEHIEALERRSPETDRAYQKAAYLKGSELFNMRQYAEAIRWFEQSMQHPLDAKLTAEAALWSGEAYSVTEQYDKAIPMYQQVIGSSAGEPVRWAARYGLGYAYFNQREYSKALIHFREVVAAGQATPNFRDGLIRLADCYYVSKSYNDALSNYRRAVEITAPDQDYVLLQMGMIHFVQRQYTQAENEFSRLITQFPESRFREEALYQRGMIHFEQSRYAEAIQGFTVLVDHGKNNRFVSYALMRRAACYYNLKQYDRTVSDYVRVVEQYTAHPAAADAMAPLQEALGLAGRSEDFTRYLELFKAANPDNKDVESLEMEAARNYFFSQDYAKAIASLDRFLSSYPESAHRYEAYYLKGEAYYRQKQWDEALAEYRLIEKEASFAQYAKVIARLAEVEFKKGAFAEAIPYYRLFSSMAVTKRDQATAWSGLMDSHFQLGAYDSADQYARHLIAAGGLTAPVVNRASLMLGKSAMARGNYEAAKDEFLTTLNSARDEYGAEANYLLGEIFFVLKEHKQCYETLVALNKNFAAYDIWVGKSYLLLSDNFVATGDIFQARGTLKSLIDNFPLQSVKDRAAEQLRVIDEEEKKRLSQSGQDSTDH